jgi:hypothetical protein
MTRNLVAVLGLTAWMTLCDRFFHLGTGTLVHFWHPFMGGGQTAWVLACFGLASLGIVATAPRFAVDHARPPRFFGEVAIMTAIYASSGFFGLHHAAVVTLAFTAVFVLRFAVSSHRGTIAIVALTLAIIGPAFESLQWQLGMFKYLQPDVIGVPWWLIPFYANGAWAVRELGALLRRAPVEAAVGSQSVS